MTKPRILTEVAFPATNVPPSSRLRGRSAAMGLLLLGALAPCSCARKHFEYSSRHEVRLQPGSGTVILSEIDNKTEVLDEPSLLDRLDVFRWEPTRTGYKGTEVVRRTDFALDLQTCRFGAAHRSPEPAEGLPATHAKQREHPRWAVRLVRRRDQGLCRESVEVVERATGATRTVALPNCSDGELRWIATSSYLLVSQPGVETAVVEAESGHTVLVPSLAADGQLLGSTLYYAGSDRGGGDSLMAVDLDTGARYAAATGYGPAQYIIVEPTSQRVVYLGESPDGPMILVYDHARRQLSKCSVPARSTPGITSHF